MPIAKRLKLRLFLEGIEIPCISATIQAQPNSPMVCSLQIPALDEATRFLPRTIVHLFFLDQYQDIDPNITKTGPSVVHPPGPSTYDQLANHDFTNFLSDAMNQRYKMVFAGELMGFQWSKSATSRSIVLQCSDFSNYWDYAFQYNNNDIFGPGYKAMFSGGAMNLFTDFLEGSGSAVVRIIQTPSERYPALKGLLGGVIHLLEAMGGSYYYGKKFAGQNIFFSISELRLHLTQMITAYSKDPTSKKLLGGGYDSLFGRSIGNLGEQASFRKVINMLQSIIFHETYGQPCPLYVPGLNGEISGFARKKVKNIPALYGIGSSAEELVESLTNLLNEIGVFAVSANPDTTAFKIDMVARLSAMIQTCKMNSSIAERLSQISNTADVPAETARLLATIFRTAATQLSRGLAYVKTTPTAPQKGPTAQNINNSLNQAKTQLQKILELDVNVTNKNNAIPSRLNQQIFRPDVWFSAPPRCNVIFPEQYMTLSYSRQFMSEPTRLMLKTNDEFFGEDELFDHFYFAPKAITLKQQANTLQAILRGDIMSHELYTGILPVFEKMGELNIFAARSGLVDGKQPKIGLAQRSTNFLYFKYRFAARQLQITGRFNPYIVVGFPGLIVDKYASVSQLKNYKEQAGPLIDAGAPIPVTLTSILGTHFLASFTEVTHQLSQQQGTTSINCSYARQPDESIEFLGNVQSEVEVMRKQPGKVANVRTLVASITAPTIGSQGPAFGEITEVRDVTTTYHSNSFEVSKQFPVYGGPRDNKTKQISVTVPVGFASPAVDYGPQVVTLVGDPNLIVSFRCYEVTETKVQTKIEMIDLPPEEYIRPGWYGDCWHPSKISEPYYDFFNIGAITEAMQISTPDAQGSGGLFSSSDASQTLADAQNVDNPLAFLQDELFALSQTKDANIQQAVSLIVLTYSAIKQGGLSVDEFIHSYTWRPIASMLDMFGTEDLQLSEDGTQVLQGVEGFFSRSFGPYEDLFGLTTPEIDSIVGLKKGSVQSQKADTRKKKHDAVLLYYSQIAFSKAVLG